MKFHDLCVKERLVVEVGFKVLPAVVTEFGGLFLLEFKPLEFNDLSGCRKQSKRD